MMQKGDFGDRQDKTEETKNQKPKRAFDDGHQHAATKDHRHDKINNDSQESLHQAPSLRKPAR